MNLPANVERVRDEIIEVSEFIYSHPELSSEEIQCSNFLVDKINSFSSSGERNYLGMETAFMARIGEDKTHVSLFAEYDALPIGHACGHNIIAAWGYGVFRALSMDDNIDFKVTLFGSPAEEGMGKYASSKVKISKEMQKLGIDAAFVIHPYTSWEVSAHYLARSRMSYIFHGKASHAAGSPERGINALDAAVTFYINNKMIRASLDPSIHAVISEIIKDGGSAVNIIPERSEVWVDVRTTEDEYAKIVIDRITRAAESAASWTGCTLEYKELAPFTSSFKVNPELDKIFYESASKYIEDLVPLDKSAMSKPIGSSDVGNVSKVVPTSQLLVKIADNGVALHTKEFLKAAGSKGAQEALLKAVAAGYDAVKKFSERRARLHG